MQIEVCSVRSPWSRALVLGGLAGLLPTVVPAHAAEDTAWRIESGDVRVTCPMTVGGSFEAKTKALSGTTTLKQPKPAAFGGEIAVDLKTLDTGIGLRNRHLRENYLEVAKGEGFDKAVLSDIQLGDVDATTFQGKTSFTGNLRLHGVSKPVKGEATIQRTGSNVRVAATFPLRLLDHAIEKPQYLGVGVKTEVTVRVAFDATPSAAKESR